MRFAWRWQFTLIVALLAAACQPAPRDLSMKLLTEDMELRVLPDPVPPRAREPIRYKVVVRDRETGEPIETGVGQIFATSESNDRRIRPPGEGTRARHVLRDDALHYVGAVGRRHQVCP